MRRLGRFITDRGGAAAIEFALIGLPLILLLLGLIEFGRGLHIRAGLDSAADRVQRMILINPAETIQKIEAEVQSSFQAGSIDRLNVALDPPLGGAFRTVILSYDMTLIMPAPIGGTVTIVSNRRVRINP